jgi:orotate phosphoribosyltransferase
MHSAQYIEKFRVLEQPIFTEMLCREIAEKFKNEDITAVAGPMTGGIIIAYETGRQLGTRAIFTERVEGKMKFRRGFTLSPSDRVLIVEDIITTGGSVLEVIEEVKKFNPAIAGISCLVDRSEGRAKYDYPFKPLIKMDVVAYKREDCPLCKENVLISKPGSTNK